MTYSLRRRNGVDVVILNGLLIKGFREAIEASGLIDIGMEGFQFTWEKSRGTPDWIEERLDRAMVTQTWLSRFPNSIAYGMEASESDHIPLFLDTRYLGKTYRQRRFRFENNWLNEPGCGDVIMSSWESSIGQTIQYRLSACGRALAAWGGSSTRNLRQSIASCKQKMAQLKGKRDVKSLEEFEITKHRYVDLLIQNETFWKQRAKQFWLTTGDANTRYFHSMASFRRRGNRISRLKDDSEVWRDNEEDVEKMMLDYFQALYMSESSNDGGCTNVIYLTAPFTEMEIKEAVFSMHPDKSPSPDGMNLAFFQRFWHVIGKDVCGACLNVLSNSKIPEGMNNTQIVLIPKKQVQSLCDLRPISLCNVIYKIVAKAMVIN